MHDDALIIARPAASDQLVLLFHGVGATARDLVPLGEALAQEWPRATLVSVEAPHRSQLGRGKEWFSVIGINEDSRPQRVADAMPQFLSTIQHWQAVTGLDASHTVLLGFSQGAIMALESTQASPAPAAAQTVVALAGRFAEPVRRAPADVHLHLVHGVNDGVVPTRWSAEAEQQWRALGGNVTLDLVPGLGHGIDGRAVRHVVDRLAQQ